MREVKVLTGGPARIELVWEEPLPSGSVHEGADSRYHVIRLSTRDYDGKTYLRVETMVDNEPMGIVETPVETSWPVTTMTQGVEFYVWDPFRRCKTSNEESV